MELTGVEIGESFGKSTALNGLVSKLVGLIFEFQTFESKKKFEYSNFCLIKRFKRAFEKCASPRNYCVLPWLRSDRNRHSANVNN